MAFFREPLVSIIIPTWNRANIVKECIDSVFSQSYHNYEVIVIDDGSTDNTENIIKESYSDIRLKYFWQTNSGLPSKARNKGISMSKGEYIAFLDSDDLWEPKKLETQIKLLLEKPQILATSTNVTFFPRELKRSQVSKDRYVTFKEILLNNYITNSSVIIRRKVIDFIGLLDEASELKAVEDFDYWLRILHNQDRSIYIIKDKLTKYRVSDDAISEINSADVLLKSVQKLKFILKKYPDLSEKYVAKLIKKKSKIGYFVKFKTLLDLNKISLREYIKNKNLSLKFKLIGLLSYLKRKIV